MSILKVNGVEYELSAKARVLADLDKRLGENPTNILIRCNQGIYPKMSDVIVMLWVLIKANKPTFKLDSTYDLYDEYIEHGGSLLGIVKVLIDTFTEAGCFGTVESAENGDAEKN